MNKILLASVAMVMLSGCATIIEGRSQTVSIESNPSCARCDLNREGMVIGSIACTPGGTVVEKTKHDIKVTCTKKGFSPTSEILESGTEGFVAGNIIAGGVIGWGVDSATGADNKYPERTIVNMVKSDGNVTEESSTSSNSEIMIEPTKDKLAAVKGQPAYPSGRKH